MSGTGTAIRASRRPGRPKKDGGSSRDSTTSQILDAALQEFAQNGFDGANISEIAKRSGVARALVHYHYANKETLWKAVVTRSFREMTDHFADIGRELTDLDPVSFLKVFIRRYVYFVARRPELGRIIIAEAPRDTPRAQWLVNRNLRPMHVAVERIYSEKLKGEPFRPIPFLNFLSILTGAVSIYFLDASVLREHYAIDPADQAVIDQHAEVVIEMLLRGMLVSHGRPPEPAP